MKTIIKKTTVYQFSELSEPSKEKAISNLYDINVNYEWWENTYEDAKNVGLKLTEFDLDRNKHAMGKFLETGLDTAFRIKAEHGEDASTYKTAVQFIENYNTMFAKYEDMDNLEHVAEEFNSEFDNELDEWEEDFLKELLGDYANILQSEYEYLTSTEAITETIEANDYDFTIDGKIYS